MAGIRDLNSGMSFEKLKDLGCFDEEFAVYGLAYIDNGEIFYVVDNSGKRIYSLKKRLLTENKYSTPVEHQIVRRQVDSGTMNDVNQQIKLDFAKQLRKRYGETYFGMLHWISRIENNDLVTDLLKEETKRITGYFKREEIQLFEGLCLLAYESKKITETSYQDFQKWLVYAHEQLENEVITKGKFQIVYYGFGYEKNGRLEYYQNAQALNAHEKWYALRIDGTIVTPIFSKEYWADDLYQLSSKKKTFLETLYQYINNDYWEKVKLVYLKEVQTEKNIFKKKLESCKKQCNKYELESLYLYKFLFNI